MVDYENVYEAFLRFAASGNQSDWCELWILCQRRMEALVKTKFKNKAPCPDFLDIITDATAEAVVKMRNAATITPDSVSRIFWIAYRNKSRDHFRELAKVRRVESAVKMITEIYCEKSQNNLQEPWE